MNTLASARAYLAKLPPAISGSGGHDATFRAACCLVRFGLGDGDAMTLLREWNGTHCQPPWTEKELIHKLNDARRGAGYERRTLAPKKSVRASWRIERKVPSPDGPVAPPPLTPPGAEALPYVTSGGDLVIPFNSPARSHWWKEGGMTPTETRRYLESEDKP